MKLPYVCALARQMDEPKQMRLEKMYTGRRPKEVLRGTLGMDEHMNVPV